MIAKELQEDWDNEKLVKEMQKISESKAPLEFPIEKRYRGRYSEVTVNNKRFLAKKSCKGCHGTGKYCFVPEDKTQGLPRRVVPCTCLIPPTKEKKDAKEA
jgi:hypothetical protein